MAIPLHRPERSVSATLADVARGLPADDLTIGQLLELVGEQGLLSACLLLATPFLIPVSIPGVSMVFGLLIVLIAAGVAFNRVPWLPRRLLERRVPAARLARVLGRAARLFARVERLVKPRLPAVTASPLMNSLNCLALAFAGLLMMMPFSIVPFTNTLPAIAAVLLATGIMQRDGLCVLAGYLALGVTLTYFAALLLGAGLAGSGLHEWFFTPTPTPTPAPAPGPIPPA